MMARASGSGMPSAARLPRVRRQQGGIVLKLLGALLLVSLLLTAAGAWLNLRGEAAVDGTAPPDAPPPAAQVERGRYLALVGNCAGCHTASPEAPYAGGRALPTPFGTVYTTNLTPDVAQGIGSWSQAHFWRAMHHGRAKDGRLLNPVFPYASYTHVTREDSDALYAYLRSLAPSAQPNRPHALRFPYDSQLALAVWRALFFRAADPDTAAHAQPARDAEWQRGAYLARGLGHCIECHSPRNALGAVSGSLELAGGAIPSQGWYAPSLAAADEAGVAQWPRAEVVRLLQTGRTDAQGASVTGPMAEVVHGSTQHWNTADLQAVASFLQALPAAAPSVREERPPAPAAVLAQGAKVYEQQCAHCHGEAGQGAVDASGARAYPALAGNRAVTLPVATNLVATVRSGGFAPATAGNPRPWGMPPFAHVLSDAEIAAVLSFIRQSWGNRASAVSELEVLQQSRTP